MIYSIALYLQSLRAKNTIKQMRLQFWMTAPRLTLVSMSGKTVLGDAIFQFLIYFAQHLEQGDCINTSLFTILSIFLQASPIWSMGLSRMEEKAPC